MKSRDLNQKRSNGGRKYMYLVKAGFSSYTCEWGSNSAFYVDPESGT
jgi:hypothetical protein